MFTKGPELPPVKELGSLAVRKLRQRGGYLEPASLRESVRAEVVAGAITNKSWESKFANTFHWTMTMLADLDEVRFHPPSSAPPQGAYELLPQLDTSEMERLDARRIWLVEWWEAQRDRPDE